MNTNPIVTQYNGIQATFPPTRCGMSATPSQEMNVAGGIDKVNATQTQALLKGSSPAWKVYAPN